MKMAHCNMHSNERKPAASDWLKPKTKCIFSSSVGKYDNEPKPGLGFVLVLSQM